MHEWVKIGVEYGILGFLGFLSFVTIAIGIERWLSYKETDIEKFDNRHDLEAHLTKNLTLLSTIASNAVYIGLLGTVLGIMITFYNMGLGGAADPKSLMQNLSFTLLATAAGLVVAIPATVIYNFCARKAEILSSKWESSTR